MKVEFYTAARILYGRGELGRSGELVGSHGRRAFVVRGSGHLEASGALARLRQACHEANVAVTEFAVSGEPEVQTIDAALTAARAAECDQVIGIGGGSALDTAKAVAGLLTHDGGVLDYMEVIGKGRPLTRSAAPFIAIPTTAGTGTEVTKNAVVADKSRQFKASMRSPHLVPKVALIDPELTDSMPPELTASTGLDALTQLIEPYVSCKAHPLTDGIALAGVRLAAGALPRAFRDGRDEEARDHMALAALMGGIALANAGLGAVHGFAAPLGASFPVPHGVACAALLPHVMRANVEALRAREPASPALAKYADVGEVLAGLPRGARTAIDAGIERVEQLLEQLRVPGLSRYGLTEARVPELVVGARRASSMKGNPIVLTDDELAGCLRAAL